MAVKINLEECIGCGGCESACPAGAISQGDAFPVGYEVDPLLCNDCNRCRAICPVEGFIEDGTWAVCHGRGCPLSSKRYANVECSEGQSSCPECGSVLWRSADGPWYCPVCRGSSDAAAHHASCPKCKKAARERQGEDLASTI